MAEKKEPDKKIFIERAAEMPCGKAEFTGVYVGSGFCQEALPTREELAGFIWTAQERGLSLHLVTPYLTESHIGHAIALAETLTSLAPGSEVIANDLGFLTTIATDFKGLKPVAGIILAFQRSDPRIMEILDTAFDGSELEKKRAEFQHISVNNPIFARFLKERHVSRIEIQNPQQGFGTVGVTDFEYSLHTPYVYITSTRFCQPVERLTSPGRIPGIYSCRHHCAERYFRLTPHGDNTRFIYRGNTVYYENPPCEIPPFVDRVIIHRQPS